jgi:hypothetical protein
MKRIQKEQLGCKFDGTYWEDVVGDGGPRMQMFECNCNKDLSVRDQELLDKCLKCGPGCPGFEPVATTICEKHDEEYLTGEWCSQCFPMGDDPDS